MILAGAAILGLALVLSTQFAAGTQRGPGLPALLLLVAAIAAVLLLLTHWINSRWQSRVPSSEPKPGGASSDSTVMSAPPGAPKLDPAATARWLDVPLEKTPATATHAVGVTGIDSERSSFDPDQPGDDLAAHGYRRLDGHEDAVWSVALTGDGHMAASGSMDGTVRIWDLASLHERHVLRGHRSGVTAVAISGDSRRLASASLDGTVRLWDVQSGECLWVSGPPPGPLFAVAFAGDALLFAGEDGTIHRRSTADGREIGSFEGPGGRVNALAVSPDGLRCAAGTATGRLHEYDSHSGRLASRRLDLPDHAVRCVGYSPDGECLAAGSENGFVTIWGQSRWPSSVVRAHSDWVRGLAFGPRDLLTVGDDEFIREWLAGDTWEPGRSARTADESLLAVVQAGGVVAMGSDSGAVYVRPGGPAT
jgi:WD40 repeat protein